MLRIIKINRTMEIFEKARGKSIIYFWSISWSNHGKVGPKHLAYSWRNPSSISSASLHSLPCNCYQINFMEKLIIWLKFTWRRMWCIFVWVLDSDLCQLLIKDPSHFQQLWLVPMSFHIDRPVLANWAEKSSMKIFFSISKFSTHSFRKRHQIQCIFL